jgi:glycosyltransferase involved in cell wall biosynthesis
MEKPLVSIMIPAHNNAETLSRCLKSVLEQDYDNLLIAVMDNHSNDDSYDILMDFEREYRNRLYTGRMHHPVSQHEHRGRCRGLVSPRTRFIQFLAPTDVLAPTYVSRCVKRFEANKKLGCVLTHADVIHPSGIIDTVPRYKPSNCSIQGNTQMKHYMAHGMDLNVTQLYRVELHGLSGGEGYLFNRFPDWLPLVMVASIADLGYIRDSLVWRGDPKAILGDQFISSLEDLFEHYLFLQAFNTIAARLSKERVCEQFPKALQRLSRECLRCAHLLLKKKDVQTAKSYLSLALAFVPETAKIQEFKQIAESFEDRAQDWR